VDYFAYSQGQLHAEQVAVSDIAAQHGTPVYIYSRATLERHWHAFNDAIGEHPHLVCYAVKANSNIGVLSVLAKLGSGFDIVSAGELARVIEAGGDASKVVFSGVGKKHDEIRYALEQGIMCFNVESEPELHRINQVAGEMGVKAPISLRINPDVDAKTHPYISTGLKANKFGIARERALATYELAASLPHLNVVGMDCHIGSQLTSMAPLLDALESVLSLVDALKAQGHGIRHIDLGGGLGIPYRGERPPHPSEFGQAVVERLRGRSEMQILEPGRVIVGNAGILLTRVLYVKKTPSSVFVIVDAAMNDLLRPSLYQAHHEIWPVRRSVNATPIEVDVVGPVCETADTFARKRSLQPLEAGDLLAIMSAGAYGFVMASNYNSRPRPAEVLVHGDRIHVVRAREEAAALMTGESVPQWLPSEAR